MWKFIKHAECHLDHELEEHSRGDMAPMHKVGNQCDESYGQEIPWMETALASTDWSYSQQYQYSTGLHVLGQSNIPDMKIITTRDKLVVRSNPKSLDALLDSPTTLVTSLPFLY